MMRIPKRSRVLLSVMLAFCLLPTANATTHKKKKHARKAVAAVRNVSPRRRRLLSLDAQASLAMIPQQTIYCKFEVPGQPKAFLVWDPLRHVAWTHTLNPVRTQAFMDVKPVVGLPPYIDGGFSILAFGDVPLASVRLKDEKECPLISFFAAIFDPDLDATWGLAPGGPRNVLDAGDCNVGRPELNDRRDFLNW
jgi:hypothetical protein